jgi:hypothetical protein
MQEPIVKVETPSTDKIKAEEPSVEPVKEAEKTET